MLTERSKQEFNKALDAAMIERGAQNAALAKACGKSPSYISRLRSGEYLAPATETMEKIASALRLSPMYFAEYRKRFVGEKAMMNLSLADKIVEMIEQEERAEKKTGG